MRFLNKILSSITVLLLLFYQIYFPLTILAQEATPSASLEQVSATPESSPSAETPTPTPIPSPNPEATPSATPTPVSDWTDLIDKSTTTKENVVVDYLYTAPQNDKVTVKFNKLPDNKGKLTIKEITLTDEQIAETKALSNIAYNISSDMDNGTFEYTLTLPTPKTENVEVKASEDGQTFVTLGGVTAQEDTLTITRLNHFTIFLISADTTGGSYTATTGPSIVESSLGQVTIGTLILNVPSGFEFSTSANSVTATVSPSSCPGSNYLKLASGSLTQTVTPTTTQITIDVTSQSSNNIACKSTITWSGIQTRPTAGTPLASGDITLSGTATLGGATFNPNTFTETVGVVVSGSPSTVSASPTSIPADGSTTSTITVTLKDASSNPVSGKTVTLASSRGATDTISAASGSSSASGVVTFTVSSSTIGSSTFTATDSTDSVTITQTAAVEFTNVPPSFDAIADQVINEDAFSQNVAIANISPGPDSEASQTVTLSATSSNPPIIPNPTFSGSGAIRTLTYTPVANANGSAIITVTANDGQSQNNTFSRTFTVTVNAVNDAPTITLTSPNGGEVWQGGGTQDITWNASDVDTSDTLTVTLEYTTNGGTSYTTITSGLSNSGTYPWTVPSINSSTVKVRATVSDGTVPANAQSNANFTIDSTAPVLTEIPPVPTYTNIPQPDYTFNSSEAGTFSVGGSCSSPTDNTVAAGNNTITLDYDGSETDLDDGIYSDCTVMVTDAAGNTSSDLSISTFTVDTVSPTGSITTPATGTYFNSPPSFIALAEDDSSGIDAVKFQYKPSSSAEFIDLNTDTTDPYAADWTDVTLTSNSVYDLQIVVSDRAGNQTTVSEISFTYDNQTPGIVYNYPTAGGATSWYFTDPGSAVNIDFLWGDGAPLTFAQRKIDTGSWINIFTADQSSDYTTNWNINWTSLIEGANQISIKVKDLAGNERMDNYSSGVAGFLFRKNTTLPTTVYINNGYSEGNAGGHTFGYDAFTTIQEGVNVAASGATINIAAGTYDEAITINKNLTVVGAGNTTVVKKTAGIAATVTTGTVSLSQIKFSGSNTAINVTGGNVTVSNSEISGNTNGVTAGSGVNVTASNNFWGASSGPTHSTNSGGNGDSISDGVAYRPLYTDSARTILSTVTVTPSDLSSLFTTGGFSVPSGATNTSTPQVNVNEALTINVAVTGGTHAISLPSGTVITKTDGTNLDATALTSSDVTLSSLSGFDSNAVIDGALQWGVPNVGLTFSTPITLSIFVGTAFNGQTLNIVKSNSASSGWTSSGIVAPATCLVASGLCSFQATSASYYATTHTTSTSSSSSSSGSTGADGGDGLGCAVHDCSGGNSASQNLVLGVSTSAPATGFASGVLGVSTEAGNVGAGEQGQVEGEATISAQEVSSPTPQTTQSPSPFNIKVIAIIAILFLGGFGIFRFFIK